MKKTVNSYITEGISQTDRFPPSLYPSFFQIEERDTGDFLQYLIRLSQKFNFYNLNNQVDGNWEDFFLSDINVVVRIIEKFDINSFIRRYDLLKGKLTLENGDETLINDLREVFQFTYDFILFQVKLHDKFAGLSHAESGVGDFRKIIKDYDDYSEDIKSLNTWLDFAKKNFGETFNVNFEEKESDYLQNHGSDNLATDFFELPDSTKEKVATGLKNFDVLFSKLRTKYYRLQEASDIFLHKRQSDGVSYSPHVGLVIAFLDLYALLKTEINNINKRHLDLYFHDILQLDYRKASPDRVYLQVDINPALQKVVIDKGETLLVDKTDLNVNNLFTVDEESIITQAKIRQLLSVYISNSIKITAKKDNQSDIIEQQLFTSVNPVNQPADFISPNPRLRSWPLMGEDQEDISTNLMTMQASDIGLLVASPLLFARDGHRSFFIKLYLSDISYQKLKACATAYADVAGSYPAVVMHSMLNEAFHLDITGTADWIRLDKCNIKCDIKENAEQCIEIHFILNGSDPETNIYMPLVHGGSYGTDLPIVRLTVNNNSFYNPYTFFQDITLERITINLTVKESKQVKLRNNIGEISIVNPFQLFGPQPAVGSYLNIKNTNIFNRFTKDFCIKLAWFDLPRESGGFENYYKGYPGHIKNNSFKISLSGINEGRFYPALGNQQEFLLFSSIDDVDDESLLAPVTVIDDIDFLRVRFDNDLSLQEEEKPEANFREGAIKFELIAPQDAFGSRNFASVFPEAVMQNAKRFSKKRSIPNPPYIPVLKAITVDYELEHSESLSGVYNETGTDKEVNIWHNYPFGYKKIYPGKNVSEFKLTPDFIHQSNLLIGLENVIPGELISLLFQLEGNNFDHFSYTPEEVHWSVLQDNVWEPINTSDILLDETTNFIKTGMVILRLPELPGTGNSILDPSLYWIKAACDNRGNIRSRTVAVFAQVVSATRQLNDEDNLSEKDLSIAPGTLSQFRRKNSQVMNVFQPFPSFNGRVRETENQFYIRVSEQLRHKNRAITATDISQLILESFPEILKIKCFDTEVNGQTILPGVDLMVIVIFNQKNKSKNADDYPKVDIAKLFTIKHFLSKVLSPFTTVEVSNPVFERVKVICSVVFSGDNTVPGKPIKSKESTGILLQRLNADIKQWISPWLYNSETNINTEGKIYLSEILNFIKKCPYVSYVTGFSVVHFFQEYNIQTGEFCDRLTDSAVQKMDYLKASSPNALLVSSPEHLITVMDKPQYVEQGRTGIGGLMIGTELVVGDGKSHEILTDDIITEEKDDKLYNFYFNPNNS